MKKILSVFLCALMLLSCMSLVIAAEDAPSRVVITACDSIEAWDNDDRPFEESNLPEPALNTEIDPDGYGVVAFHYAGPVHSNGGWGREDVTPAQGVKIAYRVAKDTANGVESYDLTDMNYMIIDIYVSNAAAVSSAEFYMELTSVGAPDREERSWRRTLSALKGEELVDGWNHFEIALDSNTGNNQGDCNFAAWNFMRIYNATAFDAGEGLTIAFKNLYFSSTSPKAAAAQAAAVAVTELFAPIADISSGDITAENYETVKAQLTAAVDAYVAADAAVQAAVEKTYDVGKIERSVTRAIEKYEEELNKPVEPDEPTTPDEPAKKGGNTLVIVIVIVAVVVIAGVVVLVVLKKMKSAE